MQAKILEWDRFIIIFAAINTPPLISFWEDVLSQIVLYKLHTSLSMGFSRQEYGSGLPSPPPEDLPDPETEPASPAAPTLQADSLLLSHEGNP